MTYVTSHDVPNLYDWCEIGLQREFTRIIKENELVEAGTENPFTKPNHPDLGKENSKTQFNSETRECDCCGRSAQYTLPP